MSLDDQNGSAGRSGLYAELKRRNVFRVAAAYIVIGWLFLQVADVLLGFTGAPDWVGKSLIALLLLGFIPSLGLAWVFEVDAQGIRVDHGQTGSAPAQHANRLDMLTLAAVAGVVVLMAWQHLAPSLRQARPTAEPAAIALPAGPAAGASDAQSANASPLSDRLEPVPGSLAVLPFSNRSAEPDTAFFVDGVHDDLLTELARNPALTVISRTSMLEYRDTTKNLRQIGEELGVAHVLEGAVQRAGQRVRINAQLIDARTDAHLWAETYDRQLSPESVFEIQSEISSAIATALNAKLGLVLTSARTSDAEPPTRNAAAYEAFLRARADRGIWAPSAIAARIRLYERAVEADPQFALAMAELGREYANRYWFHTRRDEDRQASRKWIDQALALRPEDPQVRLALAEHHYRAELDWDAALGELDRAEQGLPGSADLVAMRGYIFRRAGRPQEALSALLRAARLDPRRWNTAQTLFELYILTNRVEEARYWASIVRELPDVPQAFRLAYFESLLARRSSDSSALFAELDRLEGMDLPAADRAPADLILLAAYRARDWPRLTRYLESAGGEQAETQFRLSTKAGWQARMAAAQGNSAAAQPHAQRALAQVDALLDADPSDYRAHIEKAGMHALLGDLAAARAAIERALQNPTLARDALIRSEVMADVVFVLAAAADGAEVADALDRYLALPMRYWGVAGLMAAPPLDRHREHPAIQAVVARHADDEAGR